MKGFTRISTFTICLGLACLFLTGNVLAGTTATTVVELGDCTPGGPNRVITVPANTVTRQMNVVRTNAQNFIMRVSMGSGLEFATGTLPANSDLTLGIAGGGTIVVTKVAGGTDGDTSVDFLVDITTSFTSFPRLDLDTTGWTLRDVNNLLAGGGIVTITVKTFDAATNIEFDSGIDTVDWLNIAGASCIPPLTCTDISELTEVSITSALRSEETVVAQLVELLSEAEIIAELRTRDADSMIADLLDASNAIVVVNDGLDLAEANACLDAAELSFTRADMSAASALDSYVSSRLDAFSEVTLQTLLNLMGRAIEHKKDAMETLISVGFF